MLKAFWGPCHADIENDHAEYSRDYPSPRPDFA